MSNRSRLTNTNINDHNISLAVGHSSTLRGRRNLNETISSMASSTLLPLRRPLVSKKAQEKENAKLQLTFARVEYLQSLMKQALVEERIKKNKAVLDGQIQYYSQLVNDQQNKLNDTVADTTYLEQTEMIMQSTEILENNINDIKCFYEEYEVKDYLKKLEAILQSEHNKLHLKNVRPIKTQEDFDKFMEVMRNLLSTLEKFVKSGRDFGTTHEYANEIRNFLEIREQVETASKELNYAEKQSIGDLITALSDVFGKKYNVEPSLADI